MRFISEPRRRRLSRTTIELSGYFARYSSARLEPTKPAPPVMRIFIQPSTAAHLCGRSSKVGPNAQNSIQIYSVVLKISIEFVHPRQTRGDIPAAAEQQDLRTQTLQDVRLVDLPRLQILIQLTTNHPAPGYGCSTASVINVQ